MKIDFEKYKEQLFTILLNHDYHNEFLEFIDLKSSEGHSKKEIYKLFLEFHGEIKVDPRTKGNEKSYNRLSDFMDGFTAWNTGFRILPNKHDM